MRILNEENAVSRVLSVLLLLSIAFSGIFRYNFVMGNVGNITENLSPKPFSLPIENLSFNNTCITVYIRNSGNKDLTVDKVYVKDKSCTILPQINNKVMIPKNSTGKVYVPGAYSVGASYNVKIIFTSGYTLNCLKRY